VLDLRHAQEKIAQQELATRQQDYQAILAGSTSFWKTKAPCLN